MSDFIPREGAFLRLPAALGQPGEAWLACGPLRKSNHPDPSGFSVYAPDFFLDDPQPWLLPNPGSVTAFSVPELLARLGADAAPKFSPNDLHWQPPLLSQFEKSFSDLQERFHSGTLSKAVPVFFEQASASVSMSRLASLIAAALRAPETLMPYGYWTAHEGGFVGASPELLFSIRDGVLQTVALAGTLRAPDPAENAAAAEARFLADPKERREHTLVIDGISEALASFGAVEIGDTAVLRLPHIWHLRTPITVKLQRGPSLEHVARALHPTPALGGTPRAASVAWLRGQSADRGRFGAPFGAQLPDGSAFCLVAVRNVMWRDGFMRIGAGGGVIRESRVEREWEELRQKRESVKALFEFSHTPV